MAASANLPPRPSATDVAIAIPYALTPPGTGYTAATLAAEVLHLRAELAAARHSVEMAHQWHAGARQRLEVVCENLAPLCPTHGDGESHVLYVRALERAAVVAYGEDALRIVWEEVSS